MTKNKTCIEVGQRLKLSRHGKNISIQKAVVALGLEGWQELLRIEHGSEVASGQVLEKMAKLYSISIDYIFTGMENISEEEE